MNQIHQRLNISCNVSKCVLTWAANKKQKEKKKLHASQILLLWMKHFETIERENLSVCFNSINAILLFYSAEQECLK